MRARGVRAGRRPEPAAAARARHCPRLGFCGGPAGVCTVQGGSSARWLFRHPPCGGGAASRVRRGVLLWERAHSRCGGRGLEGHISCWKVEATVTAVRGAEASPSAVTRREEEDLLDRRTASVPDQAGPRRHWVLTSARESWRSPLQGRVQKDEVLGLC